MTTNVLVGFLIGLAIGAHLTAGIFGRKFKALSRKYDQLAVEARQRAAMLEDVRQLALDGVARLQEWRA